jgi:phosphoribosylaminoimidazolecarboxamide formyltransferase / IMP cyclohydrolase
MLKKINSALVSVFYKDGLEDLIKILHSQQVKLYSTGGTKTFIEQLGIPCIGVDDVTLFPEILGGRVKTLHPKIFGGILGKRDDDQHQKEMQEHQIPAIDLVIVDLYPFEETVANTTDENLIIEKIDIGGPSMIRAAAKNHKDVVVIASKNDYAFVAELLVTQQGSTNIEQRRLLAQKAFDVCSHYDNAISNYFNKTSFVSIFNKPTASLRYGENPHQPASFYGNIADIFKQLHGKELSYNNLVDVDAGLQLLAEFKLETKPFFGIIKHTNVCGAALANTVEQAWTKALDADPESAFGGVLICNTSINLATANAINEIFFEVLIAPSFEDNALKILQQKKNRILLQVHQYPTYLQQSKSLLNGVIVQDIDQENIANYNEVGGRTTTAIEKENLLFANILCKHLKSNAIALVKDEQLLGKGCGQTSRIDALRQAIEKSAQFNKNLQNAVLASDAFFPFDDCVRIAHTAGINAFIQPGGSVRDNDSIDYCKNNNLAMVLTGMRHFKH